MTESVGMHIFAVTVVGNRAMVVEVGIVHRHSKDGKALALDNRGNKTAAV